MSDQAEQALASKGIHHLAQLVTAVTATPGNLRTWLRGLMNERQMGELQGVLRSLPSIDMSAEGRPTKLAAGGEGEIAISLRAINPSTRRHVYAPRFPKPLTRSGWWLAMGEGDELFALKRVNLERGSIRTSLSFVAPEEPGEYRFEIYLISDSYIGLDQVHTVKIQVVA